MEPPQTATKQVADEIAEIDTAVENVNHPSDVINTLDYRHESLVTYYALNGLVFDEDADEFVINPDNGQKVNIGTKMRKMTMQELADQLRVDRKTLYRWRDQIPNFWQKVAERRKVVSSTTWLAKMHEEWRKKALSMKDWRVTEAWLRNFDDTYREAKTPLPTDNTDNYTALLAAAERDGIIEGETVSHGETDARTSDQDQPTYPQTS